MKKSDDAPINPTAFKAPSRGADTPAQSTGASPGQLMMLAGGIALFALIILMLSVKTIVISPTPNPVELKVESGIGVALGNRIVGLTNNYSLTASAKGYHDHSFTASTDDTNGGAISITLKKTPGLIHFDITPHDGAVVLIDDVVQPMSRDGVLHVEPGPHEVTITHPRHLTYKGALDVEGMGIEQNLSASLERAWANITLTSEPAGATVRHGDTVIGTTPLVAELMPDIYVLTYQLDGFEEQKQLVETEVQTDATLATIIMKPARASVLVQSAPSGARLFLDGAYVGVTPKTIALEPERSHVFSAELSGYKKARRTARVKTGESQNITLALEKTLGHMAFTSIPVADVWIDGKNLGSTPLELDLHAVEHKVLFKKDGFRMVAHTFSPDPNRKQTVHVALMTESEARHKEAKPTYKTSAGHTMVRLTPGRFIMGAPRGEIGQRSNETLRDVDLTRLYYISQHEVSKGQFRAYDPTKSAGNMDEPITNISWSEAALYSNWLSKKEGLEPFYKTRNGTVIGFDIKARGYRLPTEAEWAWAARVGTSGQPTLRFPWGKATTVPAKAGNYASQISPKDGFAKLAPIGQFAPNSAKLYDMGGNAAEWVNDYHSLPLPEPGRLFVDPMGPSRGLDYVIKGGSWKTDTIGKARLAYRDYDHKARDDVGFRLARWID